MEAFRSGRKVFRVLIAPNVRAEQRLDRILDTARERDVPIISTPANRIEQISPQAQGIVAEVEPFRYYTTDDILERAHMRGEQPMLLALDQVEDPQNLGTLLRTAEAVGIHGVLIPEHRAAPVTASVVKASAGAVQYLRVARVTNLRRELEALKEAGIWVIGIEADGEQDFDEVSIDMPFVLVVGGEDKGLGRLVRETCDLVLRIPTVGKVGSLNAATAGSIVLYDLWRRRQRHDGMAPSSGDTRLAEASGYEIPPEHPTEDAPRAHADEYRLRLPVDEAVDDEAPAAAAPEPAAGPMREAPAPAPILADLDDGDAPEVVIEPPSVEATEGPSAEGEVQAKPKRSRKTAASEPAAPADEVTEKPKRTRRTSASE